MKIEEKDKPKVIGMGVLALCLLGYLGYTFLSGPVNPPVNAQTVKPKASPTPAGTSVAVGDVSVADYLKNYQMTGVRYDPFRPNGILAPTPVATPTPAATPATATPAPSNPSVIVLPGLGKPGDPNQNKQGSSPGPTTTATPIAATPPPPPDAPNFTVKGVIIGEESVAILRQGDDLKFVQEGYPVGSGYVVGAISKDSVDLVYERNPLYHKRLSIGSGGK